jgi:hypothetical protein
MSANIERTAKVLAHESWNDYPDKQKLIDKAKSEFRNILKTTPSLIVKNFYFTFTKEPSLYYYIDFANGFTLSVEFFMGKDSEPEPVILLTNDEEDLLFVRDEIENVKNEIEQITSVNDHGLMPQLEMRTKHDACFS